MARRESKDLLTRLADAGEEAIHKLSEAPGAERVFGVASSMRDRVDELQRRVRGLEGIDRRVAELEERLAKLEGKGSTAAKRSTARTRKTTSTSSSSTAKRGTSGRSSASSRKSSS